MAELDPAISEPHRMGMGRIGAHRGPIASYRGGFVAHHGRIAGR
jgi:hypothetical protein